MCVCVSGCASVDLLAQVIHTRWSPRTGHSVMLSLLHANKESFVAKAGLYHLPSLTAAPPPPDCQCVKRQTSPVSGWDLGAVALALQDEVSTYPIALKADLIVASLKEHRITVVCGDTGSGKTTQVPQIACQYVRDKYYQDWSFGAVWIALPTRCATQSSFDRVCSEVDVSPGWYAGCRTGEKNACVGDDKVMLFLTHGYLAEVIADDVLHRVSVLIIDDAHRLSESMSFVLTMLKRRLSTDCRELRVVVMSAESGRDSMMSHFRESVGLVEASGDASKWIGLSVIQL